MKNLSTEFYIWVTTMFIIGFIAGYYIFKDRKIGGILGGVIAGIVWMALYVGGVKFLQSRRNEIVNTSTGK